MYPLTKTSPSLPSSFPAPPKKASSANKRVTTITEAAHKLGNVYESQCICRQVNCQKQIDCYYILGRRQWNTYMCFFHFPLFKFVPQNIIPFQLYVYVMRQAYFYCN